MQNNTFPTLFIGQNLIKLTSVDSTNNYLKDLLSKSEPLPEGTVIMADAQYAGRGQQQNTWHAQPGLNLTCSIYLRPVFLLAHQQFYLNIAVSLGILNALSKYVDAGLKIKWPNDIFIKNKKVGGILMENIVAGNTLKHTIAGIGLNVNQSFESTSLDESATSLSQILQGHVDITCILTEICNYIEAAYLSLKSGNYNTLAKAYVDNLYKFGQPADYRQNGQLFTGTITGITNLGQLEITSEGKKKTYNFKEIAFINN